MRSSAVTVMSAISSASIARITIKIHVKRLVLQMYQIHTHLNSKAYLMDMILFANKTMSETKIIFVECIAVIRHAKAAFPKLEVLQISAHHAGIPILASIKAHCSTEQKVATATVQEEVCTVSTNIISVSLAIQGAEHALH